MPLTEAAFIWAVGVENASIPGMGVDQLGWTTHRARWREDLDLAAATGAGHIRYGLPWPDLNPAPGRYQWDWADAVVEQLLALHLEPIWDLVHFGAPAWLPSNLRDPDFPRALADFAAAFASRYRGVVRKITPFNEMYIASAFTGGLGVWPPAEIGRHGFVNSLAPIARATWLATRAIRQVNPQAEIWLNDGADRFRTETAQLAPEAEALTLERYAGLDLLCGIAGPGSETAAWLVENGFPAEDLAFYASEPAPPDVIGLDYYPGTEHFIRPRQGPRSVYDWGQRGDYESLPDPTPAGLAATAGEYHARYGLPLYVAETSAEFYRQEWLEWSTSECARAREAGIPLVGYTWWPLFDHIDWNSGLTRLVGHVCPGGLYHLQPSVRDRLPSALLPFFTQLARSGAPRDLGRRDAPIPSVDTIAAGAVIDALAPRAAKEEA